MELLIWIVLVAVAVSDAKEHRIPNVGLLSILCLSFINKAFIIQDFSLVLWSLVAGVTCFICALALYFIKVMAAGDVKLLGVVGFWLGSDHIYSAVFWVAVASVVVGLLYALLRLAQVPDSGRAALNKYSLLAFYGVSDTKFSQQSGHNQVDKLRMPFAPVVVLGVAVYFYFLNR